MWYQMANNVPTGVLSPPLPGTEAHVLITSALRALLAHWQHLCWNVASAPSVCCWGGGCCNSPFPFDSLFQWLPHTQLRLWVIVCLFFHCITSEVAFPELEDRLFPAPHLAPLGARLGDILPQHWASGCSFWVLWPRVVLDLCTSLRQQKYRRNLFYPNPYPFEDPPPPCITGSAWVQSNHTYISFIKL